MNPKTTDFLFGCKNLYNLSIHPFDFDKSDRNEYKQLIELGKEIITKDGIQSFAGFVSEYQYRVGKVSTTCQDTSRYIQGYSPGRIGAEMYL